MASKPLVQHLCDDLNDVVDKYRSQGLTQADTIGAFEIVKLDLFFEFKEENDDDILD